MTASTDVHPTAVVHDDARLGEGVVVGPYCVIGEEVEIGAGTRLVSHVTVEGRCTLGEDNVLWPMSSIGGPPQDLKYGGEPTELRIGSRNRIREFVTINRGTAGGGGVTRVGDENLLMAYVHVAHDCQVGSRNVFANAATLAGHVEVGSDANIGAFCAVHQFCRVADHAFIGGGTIVTQDVLPWVTTVAPREAKTHGLNLIGLRRRGLSRDAIQALKLAYTTLFRSKLRLEEAVEQVEREAGDRPEVRYLLDFIRGSKRGIVR